MLVGPSFPPTKSIIFVYVIILSILYRSVKVMKHNGVVGCQRYKVEFVSLTKRYERESEVQRTAAKQKMAAQLAHEFPTLNLA